MSTENVARFYEAMLADETVKKRLVAIGKQFTGEQLDEAKRSEISAKYIVPLAAEMGYAFTVEELRTYEVDRLHSKGDGAELDNSELEAVAGGAGFGGCLGPGFAVNFGGGMICFIIGISF